MICPRCNKQIKDNSKFCPYCGERFQEQTQFQQNNTQFQQGQTQFQQNQFQNQNSNMRDSVDFDKYKKKLNGAQENLFNKVKDMKDKSETAMNSSKRNIYDLSSSINKLAPLMVQENERPIASLGLGYIMTLIQSRKIRKEFLFLTDRRLYFRGKSYKNLVKLSSRNEETTVDLEDVTNTGFVYTRKIWQLIVAVILFLLYIGGSDNLDFLDSQFIRFLLGIILPLILVFVFIKFPKTYFFVKYKGEGNIMLEVTNYGLEDLREFNKAIKRAKDQLLSKNPRF